MVSREWFDEQDDAYRESVIPADVRARVSVEAGIAQSWHAVVGDAGRSVSIEHYGASAAYQTLYDEFGITTAAVVQAAKDSIATAAGISGPGVPPKRASSGPVGPADASSTPLTPTEHSGRRHRTMNDRLKALADAGVSIWLDDLSRQRLTSGSLRTLIEDKHVVGVTTNPTIFAKAISDANAYAEIVGRLAAQGVSTDEAIRVITTDDVRDAADLFKPVYDDTDGQDGRVSIEVEPGFARDTQKTIDQAKELWEIVGRENVFIKIPATQEGLAAITATLAAGISVNVTLIFSLERYKAVVDAFLSGVEQAIDNGHDVTKLASVASFFVSRVDTEIDKRLDAIGTD